MKLTNLKITPKLGILVGITMLGLCAAGVLAGYLMQREMLNGRVEQTRAIVDMARNMALGLQKQVEAGQMTKDAAIAEFSKRGNTLTFDNGNGYLFGYTMDGVALLVPVPAQIGQNRLDIETGGRKLVRELRDTHDATIVLTTHDMLEADALCDRIAIIHQGTVRALGTLSDLRDQTGKHYLEDVFRAIVVPAA